MTFLSFETFKKFGVLACFGVMVQGEAEGADPGGAAAAAVPAAQAVNIIHHLNWFTALSWRSINIWIEGRNCSIHNYLVGHLNRAVWEPVDVAADGQKRISRAIPPGADPIGEFNFRIPELNPLYEILRPFIRTLFHLVQNKFAREGDYELTPRQWMRVFDLREIIQFKTLVEGVPEILDDHNFATDDLVKARSLTGTFYAMKRNECVGVFSGMLAQRRDGAETQFVSHTCLHGFDKGNGSNNVMYYFVPYGVSCDPHDPRDPNFVPKVGFLVTHVVHYRNGQRNQIDINNRFFEQGSLTMNIEATYSNPDYAQAIIGPDNKGGAGIIELMREAWDGLEAGNPFAGEVLPTLQGGEDLPITPYAARREIPLGVNERLFLIGYGALKAMNLEGSDLAVSTTTGDASLTVGSLRSSNDDEDVKTPRSIISHLPELSSSLANYEGMSGGPILRCRLNPANPSDKRCVLIGTNWGGERRFNLDDRNIHSFSQVIDRIPG